MSVSPYRMFESCAHRWVRQVSNGPAVSIALAAPAPSPVHKLTTDPCAHPRSAAGSPVVSAEICDPGPVLSSGSPFSPAVWATTPGIASGANPLRGVNAYASL